MRSARTTLIALLLAVALGGSAALSTGCTSSAKGESEGGTKAVTYKIGVGMPITQGATALGEGITRSAELAVKEANSSERAKELGITFEVASGDDLGDPKTGVTVANLFSGDPKMIGIMGHLNSGVCLPASKVYSDNNLVMVAPAATNPELTLQGLENVFRLSTIDTVQGSYAADAATGKLGFKKAFVIDDSTPYGEGLAAEFAKGFKAAGGTVLETEKISDKDTEFSALATRIKAANPDVVYLGGVYNAGALLLKQIRDTGSKAAFMGGDGLKDDQLMALGTAAAAEGALATSIGLPLEKLEAGEEFITAYEAEYPGKDMSAYDAYGYDSINVIIDAAFAVADEVGADKLATPAGRKAIIEAVSKTDTEGLTGKIAFDEKGDTVNKVITLYVVKNGQWVAYE